MIDKKERLDSSMFEFVQAEKKIFDKKFETKPIGYFKDAMIRFSKNRTNVVATIILFIIIGLSVFVPIFSNKNAEVLEEQLAYLPPRVPVLENWGIFDGTIERRDQQVDLSTINPETGLGLPLGIDESLIEMDTLENYFVGCTDKLAVCQNGENVLNLDNNSDHVAILSVDYVTLMNANESVIKIDLDSFHRENADDTASINVYAVAGFGPYVLIGTITEPGVTTIDPFETMSVAFTYTRLKIEFVSDNPNNAAVLKSVEVYDKTSEDPVYSASGYSLSQYTIDSTDGGAGSYVRQNGQLLLASYRYRAYEAAFGIKTELAFPSVEYEAIIAANPECVKIANPDNPAGWYFAEGCPITEVIKKNESVWVAGVEYYSYQVTIDYALYRGYDSMPYFIFGTSAAGKDLFKLVWIATRTSLLIGLIVAAINISVGIVYGAVEGYYGGKVDIIMERFTEIVGRIPWLVTLSIAVSLLGPGIHTLIIILIISGWIGVAGITRTQFYRYKGREYVLASRTLGAKDGRLIFRHILPNAIGTIITTSILTIPYVIFSESTISYLGFGIGHGSEFRIFGVTLSGVSLGVLLSDGRNQLMNNPYLTMFPAVIISILMITFNMFGNALRDAFNPALRGSE